MGGGGVGGGGGGFGVGGGGGVGGGRGFCWSVCRWCGVCLRWGLGFFFPSTLLLRNPKAMHNVQLRIARQAFFILTSMNQQK